MRKLLCLILILSHLALLNVVCANNDAVKQSSAYSDVLQSLDISIPVVSAVTDGGAITRAQFAAALLKLRGYGDNVLNAQNEISFSDVAPDHELKDSIYAAAALEIMNGSNGYFSPDNPITYSEAVCAAVRVLGYDVIAANKGGYPFGYLTVATQLSICNGVDAAENDTLTRDAVTLLLYNMLDAKVLSVSVYSEDYLVYDDNSKNLMEAYLDAEKVKGVVTATQYSKIASDIKIPDGCVEINGDYFNVGNTDAEAYLGLQVMAYARLLDENDDYKTIVYIEKRQNNDILEINIKDIVSVKGFDSADSIEYKKSPVINYAEGDRIVSVRIKPTVEIAYNGIITDSIENNDFTDGSGTVVLSDTSASGEYDFISISNYKSYMVDKINIATKELYIKNSGVVLDLSSESKDIKIFKYSQKIDFNMLSEKDIVSVAVSKTNGVADIASAEKIKIIASSEVVEEKAHQLDITDKKVVLSDKAYDVAEDAMPDININIVQKFYIDAFGCVCYVENALDGTGSYAYYLGHGKLSEVYENVMVKLLPLKEEADITYDFAERVRYTGADATGKWVSGKSMSFDDLYAALNVNFTTNQLIKFKLNADGKVSEFAQAMPMEDVQNYGGYDKEQFTLEESAESNELVIQNNMLTQTYRMDKQTVAVIVPDSGDTEDIIIGTGDTVASVQSSIKRVHIYDATESLNAGVVVVEISEASGSMTPIDSFVESTLFVVEKVGKALNDDGEDCYKLTGYSNGVKKEFLTKDNTVGNKWSTNWNSYNSKTKASELSVGDAVLLEFNAKNEVTGVMILLSFNGTSIPTTPFYVEHNPNQSFGTLLNTSYGAVTKNTDSNTLRLSSSDKRIFAIRGNVYLCNLKNNTISVIKPQEIRDSQYSGADWALIRARKNEVYDIVVYRK